jgi:hypothetical protein
MRRFVFFAPLPVLERVPIGVVFVRGGWLAGRLLRFACRGFFVRASLVTGLLVPLFSLMSSTTWFALAGIGTLRGLLMCRIAFGLSGAEGSLEIEVRTEIVVCRRRRRSALRAGRTSRATLRPSRFAPPRSLGFFSVRSRPRGFTRRLGGGLCLTSRRWSRLVEQQVLGGNLGVGRRGGSQVNAEQVFGQGLPGVFIAARAGAQRIGVHKALITIIKRTRGQSLRRKAAKTAAQGKH